MGGRKRQTVWREMANTGNTERERDREREGGGEGGRERIEVKGRVVSNLNLGYLN